VYILGKYIIKWVKWSPVESSGYVIEK
jgi:hypothetical protein